MIFRKKELLNFYIQRGLFGFGYSLMIPIIALYFNDIGLSTVLIGFVMSLYGVCKALMQIPFGLVCKKIGDKLMLIISFGLMAVIPILYSFTSNYILSSILYITQGAILGISAPATYSLLSRSLDKNKRGKCTGYASAVFTLSGAIGALIGGFIGTRLSNYKLVFYLSSIFIIITAIFIYFKIENSKGDKDDKKDKIELKSICRTIKENKLKTNIFVLGSIALLGDFIYGCIVSIFPFYGQEVLMCSAFYTSIIISVYLFVFGLFAPLAGIISDKIGVKKQFIIAFIIMIISLFFLSVIKEIIIFTVAIIIYFLGATLLNGALQHSLLKYGDNREIKDVVFGFVGGSESLGYAIGPLISAYVYKVNKQWLFPGLTIITLTIFILFIILRKKAFKCEIS